MKYNRDMYSAVIPAPSSAAPPNTHGCQPVPVNAASMIRSLDQKPEKGGIPRIASQPSAKVTQVMRMTVRSAPNWRMFTSSFIPCITAPAPRNRPALKKPWVMRWKIANAYPTGPRPAASTMYPIWDMVEAARAFLMSSLEVPTIAPNSSVTAPTITTTSCAAGAASKIAPARTIRYTPAVTMVAAWISADTGVGPAMASPSQACSGTWADLPQAASSSVSPITVSTPSLVPSTAPNTVS